MDPLRLKGVLSKPKSAHPVPADELLSVFYFSAAGSIIVYIATGPERLMRAVALVVCVKSAFALVRKVSVAGSSQPPDSRLL